MSSDVVTHSGRITAITPEKITVEIISESACSACHASGLCGLSESKKKEVEVPFTFGDWSVGKEVEVNLKKTMGLKAVWLGYVIPLAVLLAVLLGASAAGVAELACGLVAIASVAVYYLIIYLFRDKLRNEYSFYIKEK